jgi:hypothetical protein
MESFFDLDTLPFEDITDKEFGSSMETDGPLFDKKFKSELEATNGFIDDFLAEISEKCVDKQPASPFDDFDILSIPSPSSCDSHDQEKTLMVQDQLDYESQLHIPKSEPKIDYLFSEQPMDSPPPHKNPKTDVHAIIRNIGKQHQADTVIYVDDSGEHHVISIAGIQNNNQLHQNIKTDRSQSPPFGSSLNDHLEVAIRSEKVRTTKKEQNKKASQRYREKKRQKEKDQEGELERLKMVKVTKEKELSKIQGKNECLLESIERKFAHLFKA